MYDKANKFKILIIILTIAIVFVVIIAFGVTIFNDKLFKSIFILKKSKNGNIEITQDMRKEFLHSDYFASIVGLDVMPSESEKITVDEMRQYINLMNKLLIGLYYNNQLTTLKEPVYINKGNNYEYEYKIKSSKLLKILENTYGIKVTKEELSSSEKYVNSLYYNKSDDCCYISSRQIDINGSCNFIGLESIEKSDDIYVMNIYYYSYIVVDTSFFEELIDEKNSNQEIINGDLENVIGINDEEASYIKKRVTFKINSIFGKNKFKILNVENI